MLSYPRSPPRSSGSSCEPYIYIYIYMYTHTVCVCIYIYIYCVNNYYYHYMMMIMMMIVCIMITIIIMTCIVIIVFIIIVSSSGSSSTFITNWYHFCWLICSSLLSLLREPKQSVCTAWPQSRRSALPVERRRDSPFGIGMACFGWYYCQYRHTKSA